MRIALILISSLLSFYATAIVRTVSNMPNGGAQFTSIQSAVDASSNGDSIYIHGSTDLYSGFNVTDKKLAIFGPGWGPDKSLSRQALVLLSAFRNSPSAGNPDGSEVHGIVFVQGLQIVKNLAGDLSFGNLKIIRCQFNSPLTYDLPSFNNTIEGSVFHSSINSNPANTLSNFTVRNCWFFTNTCCSGSLIAGINGNNFLLDHNLFYANGGVQLFANGSTNLTLTNNIFITFNVSGVSFSVFNNNLTFNCTGGNTPWTVNNNTDGGSNSNITNSDPQMVDQAAVNSGNGSPFLNFTIAAGPANNAGTDGKDIGLLFDPSGSLNWTNSRNSRLPRVFNMNISNPTIAPGGNLNVSIDARKSN